MKVQVATSLLEANDIIARENRKFLAGSGVYLLNLMSSPGSGKTTIIERLLRLEEEDAVRGDQARRLKIGVIEGDIQGTKDAERVERYHVPVVQINTYGACHLDARMVRAALEDLPLSDLDLVFVENVGNLVCPAEFDVGEDLKAMVLSVAEGDDKPEKYPLMFKESALIILNKMDLLPYTEFNMDALNERLLSINPSAEVFKVSARTGDGMEDLYRWLKGRVLSKKCAITT